MVKSDFAITFIDSTEATLRFRVKEFSKMQGPKFSPPCYVLNIPWRIMIMPMAVFDKDIGWSKRYLGYFLQCNADSKSKKWSCYAIADLAILGTNMEEEPYRKSIRHTFDAKQNHYGYKFFMPWDDILDVTKGFIENDEITLEMHIITEAPKTMGIWSNWGNYEGRIFVPKEKWSDACKSRLIRNWNLEEERSSMIPKNETLLRAEELFVLLHDELSPPDKAKDIQPRRPLTDKIEEEIESSIFTSAYSMDPMPNKRPN